MVNETCTVHLLRQGKPLCHFTDKIPALWPNGHKWARLDTWHTADYVHLGHKQCEKCLELENKPTPKTSFKLEKLFSKPYLDKKGLADSQKLWSAAFELAKVIRSLTPECVEQTLAFRKLQECVMMADFALGQGKNLGVYEEIK